MHASNLLRDRRQLLLCLRSLHEQNIRTEIGKGPGAPQGFLEPQWTACIGPCHDQYVAAGLALVNGGADSRERFFPLDDLLALHMPAALRADLVLDHHAREAGLCILGNRASYVQRIAVARISIADDRNGNARADVSALVDHLAEGDQPGVRLSRSGG